MPEAVLASTTIPIVTPLVEAPLSIATSSSPVQAVSPRDANAVAPTYPGIPEPGQDLVSLQTTVLRLKETVEMMNGTRGDEETDLVGGYLLLQKSTANSSARLEILNQVTANANFAMATRITTLEAEFRTFTGVDPTGTTFNAKLTETLQVYTDADEALALRSTNLEAALVMAPGTSASARLTSIESVNVTQGTNITANATAITTLSTTVGTNTASIATLTTSVNGVAVKFGVLGTINGISGGFTFSGVTKNDGTASYFMEFNVGSFIIRNPATGGAATVFDYDGSTGLFTFNGNVQINGNLGVTGTFNNRVITDNAVSNNTAASEGIGSGGTGATCGLSIRQGGRLLITAMMVDGTLSYATSSSTGGYPLGQARIFINGAHVFTLNLVRGLVDNFFNGTGYLFWRAFSPSAAEYIYGPLGAGSYTVQIVNDTPFTLTFSASLTELAK